MGWELLKAKAKLKNGSDRVFKKIVDDMIKTSVKRYNMAVLSGVEITDKPSKLLWSKND